MANAFTNRHSNTSQYLDRNLTQHFEFLSRISWQNLLKLLSQREQKLHGAGEIHRFHRDVAEALFRIQDKNAALSNELGRDLNSALALLRKHEGFENDLVALEAQLQVYSLDSSIRLIFNILSHFAGASRRFRSTSSQISVKCCSY